MPKSYVLDDSKPRWPVVHSTGEVLCTHYGRGTVVHHMPVLRVNGGDSGPREVIRDQSAKSRRNAAFKIGNADVCEGQLVTWLAMLCLTWHDAPKASDVKSVWKKFARRWRVRFGEPPDAWLMEIQTRGAPHFHVFIAAESEAGKQVLALLDDGKIESVSASHPRGNGRARVLVRGNFAKGIARDWLECSGQSDNEAARWWHEDRGIVEMVDSPDAAGRYIAKENAKRQQKELPPEYAEGLGQWWRLNPKWKPRGRKRGFLSLDDWPFPQPYGMVWETAKLAGCSRGSWSMEDDKRAAPFVSAWLASHPSAITPESLDDKMLGAIRERNRHESLCATVPDTRSESDVQDDYLEAVAKMAERRS